MGAAEVHAGAAQVLGFWFAMTPEQHFAKSEWLDAEIAERFGVLRNTVLASEAKGWRDDPETLLAAIILLDQFSRNVHRGTAGAFAADALALELTLEAIGKGWDGGMTGDWLQFLYMPLMHAEDREMQRMSVEKFGALGDAYILGFARSHAEVIEKFGRFPSRNAALGRDSTPEEREYLSQPGAGW
ncbi:MAG: DUF924 domain-containing protein [Sphingomonadales bacterium]|nr:MAG: DUF924 domain-containing protein [Sphingomonadales bacterium]